MKQSLDEYLVRLGAMPPEKVDQLFCHAHDIVGHRVWHPNPGPQTEAYFCEADLLLYGGAGGGGKTDLLEGLALTKHLRSLLLRPQYTDLGALIERVTAIAGTKKGLNSAPPARFVFEHRLVDFGAARDMDKAEPGGFDAWLAPITGHGQHRRRDMKMKESAHQC